MKGVMSIGALSGKEPFGVKDGSDGAGYYFDEGNQGNGMATTTTTTIQ